MDVATGHVDVLTLQRSQLTEPHAGESRQEHQEPIARRGASARANLVHRQLRPAGRHLMD
jgi:hypothetical protein